MLHSFMCTVTVNTVWERELWAFIMVAAVCRFFEPFSKIW